jgi:hypothetical protein
MGREDSPAIAEGIITSAEVIGEERGLSTIVTSKSVATMSQEPMTMNKLQGPEEDLFVRTTMITEDSTETETAIEGAERRRTEIWTVS